MPRPRAISRSDSTVISNAEMARVFNEIADMLEISGELVYKAVAYRRVADAVERWPDDVAHLFQSEEPPKIRGAGDHRPAGLLRPDACPGPERPAGDPEDPRGRAAHGEAAPRRAGDRLGG